MRVIWIVLALAGCEYRGDEPFRHGGKAPPNFAGILDAQPYSAYAVLLTWTAANDDTTDPPAMQYDIWSTTAAGSEDFGSMPVRSVVGTTRALIGGLMPGHKYYFIVRARDIDGNHDGNVVELDATTTMPAPATRTLTTDIQPILRNSCADTGRCHGPIAMNMGMEQGMDFSTVATSAAALLGTAGTGVPAKTNPGLGRLRVKPGDSGKSFLMDKLLSILAPDDGAPMPYDTSLNPISDDDKKKIAEWIDQGAMR
jgi:hypothetical protein